MQGLNQHIIQKQTVEVIATGALNGFALQKETEEVCKESLIPGIERLLDTYELGEEIIRIDKLVVEVNMSSSGDLGTTFTNLVLREIEAALQEKIQSTAGKISDQPSSVVKREIALLVFYLQTGYLLWWSSVKNTAEWQVYLSGLLSADINRGEWSQLSTVFFEDSARQRLVSEFTEEHFWMLIKQILPTETAVLQQDLNAIKDAFSTKLTLQAFVKTYKNSILKSWSNVKRESAVYSSVAGFLENDASQFFRENHHSLNPKVLKNDELRKVLEKWQNTFGKPELPPLDSATGEQPSTLIESDSETPIKSAEDELLSKEISLPKVKQVIADEIYIANSGLVILALYLPLFFKNLELVERDKLVNVPKAVALLHYIIYGNTNYLEFECVLAKLLCGVELSAVVEKYHISDAEKQQADELLQAVIEHWQVLKNTSIAGLRTSFLQRDGRLLFADNEWKLKVQNEAYDVLLAQLPWNISMIKLPWMKYLLRVDWI